MSRHGRILALAGDERGAVLVMFALFAPVAILFASFALDTGNWFLHQRHLQVQADAAALAAAQDFPPNASCSSTINAGIEARAGQYGGASSVVTPKEGSAASTAPLYNEQTGGVSQSNIHELINSKTYYKQSSPVDGTAEEKPPCEANMIDVKMTETNLPWYWRALSTVPYINAHARVEILQQTTASKVQPLAVSESAPTAAEVYFVNEDNNNAIIAKAPLKDIGVNGQGQQVWANSEAPLSVALSKTNATTAHIGVLIALSGKAGDTTCPEHEYVKCFDEKTGPLLHIAGYSNAGTGTVTAPLARQVTLSNPSPNTCTDGYFSNSAGSCTFTISAKIDYGSANRTGITVKPLVGGTSGSALTYNTVSERWTGTATLPSGSGSNEIKLVVACSGKAGSPCEKEKKATEATISDVQRIYAASSPGSGTIAGAWISEVAGQAQDANSFEVCEGCTHKLVVTVDLAGSLADAQQYSDPVYHLRFGEPQAEVVGCPPPGASSGAVYRENLESGCKGTYKINTSDPSCTGTTEPYDCIGFASGVKVGPFSQGLTARFETKPAAGMHFYCPNNWINSNSGGVPSLPSNDSRIIQLFVEPYGSNGSKNVPIQDFATFYVTGWEGDGCNSTTHPEDATAKGEVVGHFVKYINTLNNSGGEQKCNTNSLGECVAVLTR
jgi:Flp pilus assembly protein TadG